MPTKQRVQWIDIARAMAMFLVFFGHLGDSWFPALNPIIQAIYTFHMPLFFVLSGLFFKPAVELAGLLKKRARTLLIPYYVFSVFALVAPVVKLLHPSLYTSAGKSAKVNPLGSIASIIFAQGNAGLWFLWSLFVASLILWVIIKIIRDNTLALTTILLACIVLNFAVKDIPFVMQLPFQIGKIFEATAYVGLGHVLAKLCNAYSWDHINRTNKLFYLVVSFVLFLLMFFSTEYLAISNIVIQCLLSFLTTLAGIATVICLSLLVPPVSVISIVGKDSLVFYALNDISLKIVKFALFSILRIPVETAGLPLQLLLGLLTVLFAMALSFIGNVFIQHHMRWSIGDIHFKDGNK